MDNIKYLCFTKAVFWSLGVCQQHDGNSSHRSGPSSLAAGSPPAETVPDWHLLINSRPNYVNCELRLRFMGSFQRCLKEGYLFQFDSTGRRYILEADTILLSSQNIWVFPHPSQQSRDRRKMNFSFLNTHLDFVFLKAPVLGKYSEPSKGFRASLIVVILSPQNLDTSLIK